MSNFDRTTVKVETDRKGGGEQLWENSDDSV